MPSDKLQLLLGWAVAELRKIDIESPQLDARLLLQHATGLSREDLIIDPDRGISPAAFDRPARRS